MSNNSELDFLLKKIVKQSKGVVNPCSGLSIKLKKHLFDLQLEILHNKEKFKLLNASRRFGKTTLAAIKLSIPCLEIPESKTCYASTTKSNAKSILWNDLINILEQYNIPFSTNIVELTITFPNKSKIVFAGLHNKRDTEELRGKRYHAIIIDEAAFIGDHLGYAIDDVLRPTLLDYEKSELWLMSTPNASLSGYFYEQYKSADSKYKKYEYDFRQNPNLPRWAGKKNWRELAEKAFQEERAQYEKEGKLTKFQREFEAKWIRDTEQLCFPDIKTCSTISDNLDYYIGIDVGWNDETAIVVCGVDQSATKPIGYIVETVSESKMYTSEIADILKQFDQKYNPISIAADSGGGGKRLIEDINNMLYLNIQSADKPQGRKKADISMINDLFRSGRFFIHESNKQAISELSRIQFDEKGEIDRRFPDHILDALVYNFRQFINVFGENEKENNTDYDRHDMDSYKEWEIQQQKERDDELDDLFGINIF